LEISINLRYIDAHVIGLLDRALAHGPDHPECREAVGHDFPLRNMLRYVQLVDQREILVNRFDSSDRAWLTDLSSISHLENRSSRCLADEIR
jgi:hypothetical protein